MAVKGSSFGAAFPLGIVATFDAVFVSDNLLLITKDKGGRDDAAENGKNRFTPLVNKKSDGSDGA